MRTLALASLAGLAAAGAQGGSTNCVSIGKPKPSVVYTYEHVESTGRMTRFTQQWESVTDKSSRVRVNRPGGTEFQTDVHQIVDDVMRLVSQLKTTASGAVIESTSFSPALVGDPAFRACTGRSWAILPVTATYRSSKANASTATPAGTLSIVAIREPVTVPAGTFNTVQYVRTSQSRDVYWKSIDHGVVVKQISSLQGGAVTMTLVGIK